MILAVIRTDGRGEYLIQAIASFAEMVSGPITRRVIHDDSGDPVYTAWLRDNFPDFEVIAAAGRSGFAGAIQSVWRHLEDATERYVLDLEDDFLFTRPVDLTKLSGLLDARPYLAQIALKRQRWGNEPEGGFIAQAPDWYTEHRDNGFAWIETRRNHTTNPSLYRQELVHVGWPDAPDSEGYFGFALKDDIGLPWGIAPQEVQFGIWGAIDDPPAIEHIGIERNGLGY